MEDHGDYLFIVMSAANCESDLVNLNQVCLIIGPNYVLSCHETSEPDSFEAVRERLKRGKGRIRKQGVDYLAYALMDAVVDDYFGLLGQMADMLDDIDEKVATGPDRDILKDLHEAKKQLMEIRRMVWPVREMLLRLTRLESPLITDEVAIFLGMCTITSLR